MTRPTRAEVDEALRTVREETLGSDDPSVFLEVLAAEVRALRDLVLSLYVARNKYRGDVAFAYTYLAKLFVSYAPRCTPLDDLSGVCSQIDNLLVTIRDQRETLARVEALLPESCVRADDYGRLVRDLRAALRGEP